MNRLIAVADLGQSLWLDNIRRDLILNGGLDRLVREDGLKGVTSNPSIFEKAIAQSTFYDLSLRAILQESDGDAKELFELLALRDIQDAADVLHPVYEKTRGGDGFVSVEVSPYLARDTEGTLNEARRLWRRGARPNLFVKIPATPEGIPAIRQALSEGININITLLFAQKAYEQVAEAYLEGLEAFAARGGDPARVASVASFFISRIDTLADALLAKKIATLREGSPERARAERLLGTIAIANGKQTYRLYKKIFSGPRWEALRAKGARTQRVLWASTSTKNPAYRDVLYVEELIGPDTVNTLPPQTIDAFRDHGEARPTLEQGLDEADAAIRDFEALGLSLKEVTDRVLEEGVRLFSDSFDQLLAAVERKRREILGSSLARQTISLPAPLEVEVQASLEEWRRAGNIRRLWRGDASLWTGGDEGRWLGWLDLPWAMRRDPSALRAAAGAARRAGFSHVLVLGMGGSSLAPDVLRRTFERHGGETPELLVLDSTDPGQVASVASRVPPESTLFIVSSKSGTTLEPNLFRDFFLDRARQALGPEKAPLHFVAITDPGSSLEAEARKAGFHAVFPGVPSVGGRYSALSNFGLVPAACAGIDTDRFLERALVLARSCSPEVPPAENPGVLLGTVLAILGRHGRDKVTFVVSPAIESLGAWLEQLLAESTGKIGKGLIPIDRETPGAPGEYGADRLFVYVRLRDGFDAAQDKAVEALGQAGHPVVRVDVPSREDLGGEFFRWEIATAVAGAVLGLNPFDQPDVEASKVATRSLVAEAETKGALPSETPLASQDGLSLFADARNGRTLEEALVGGSKSAAALLKAHLDRLHAGDYFALLAYLEMNDAHEHALQAIRHRVRRARKVATCLGFGPRFLHSTGQAYKGGPPSGVFLQVTCDDAKDLPLPGRKATFGLVKAAQARGDFQVLAERGRRALRIHLGRDTAQGLRHLGHLVEQALG
ncbi:MAG TPA: bifunctional transaldolase/phosoglucose isomerase [Candidatus Polarisedimenticolia bacterium]|nr:bifunctional transaldolase/phosoglucose isomerase [Candidatus Polarisedimenticolia bacterium]